MTQKTNTRPTRGGTYVRQPDGSLLPLAEHQARQAKADARQEKKNRKATGESNENE